MPRRSKGPRLYLDPAERVWVIRDGTRKRRTGCGEGELGRAETILARYIAEKYEPTRDHHPGRLLVADVLKFYLSQVAPGQRSAATTAYAADRLIEWWGAKVLSEVRRSTCAAYAAHRQSQPIPQAKRGAALERRVSVETVRRELTVLRAAIHAYHAENTLDAVPVVTLPEASAPRDRWLTRAEAARMLRAARAHPQRATRTAVSRFLLVSLYTGTRSGAVRALQWIPNTSGGWVDLDAGVMHRRAAGARETKKRQPPLRIPRRLLAHLRRWRAIDERSGAPARHVVHHAGAGIEKQRRSWDWVRTKAGLGSDVVPHILRHTCATWIMQGGADLWDAAGFLGMSPEILWRVYGHHHPEFQRDISERVGRK